MRDLLNQQATMFAQVLQAAQAAQRPAPTTPTSAAREEIRSLVDPKLLEKTPNFDGQDREFGQWSFVFSSAAGLLGLEEAMAAAHAAPLETDVALAEMNDQSRSYAKVLWYLLINCVRGKALNIIQGVERMDGLLAWRKLLAECQPAIGGRLNTMLISLLSPLWEHDKAFDETLAKWEIEVLDYERQSGDKILPRYKIAVVTKHAPELYRSTVVQAAAEAKDDYAMFRQRISDTLQAGQGFGGDGLRSGTVPVVVGALDRDKCASCGKMGHWAKDWWGPEGWRQEGLRQGRQEGLRQGLEGLRQVRQRQGRRQVRRCVQLLLPLRPQGDRVQEEGFRLRQRQWRQERRRCGRVGCWIVK